MKLKKYLYKTIIIIVYCISCIHIYNKSIDNNIIKTKEITNLKEIQSKPRKIKIEKPKYIIKIDKIKINKPIYHIESINNNVEKNVTLLQETNTPEKEDSHIFLAAHSGNSNIAYFDKIYKLKINNEIKLKYYNNEYKYIIIDIREENKNGYISIKKYNQNTLTLTTCSKNKNKQLIITALKKD